MNCQRFRELLHDCHDGHSVGGDFAAMEAHAESCQACRTYEAEMSAVFEGLDDLRAISAIVPDEPAGAGGRVVRRRRWTGIAAMAAGVALAVLVGVAVESLVTRAPHEGAAVDGPRPVVATFTPVVTLSEETAARFIPVPAATDEPNVHVVWLHAVVPSPTAEKPGGSAAEPNADAASS